MTGLEDFLELTNRIDGVDLTTLEPLTTLLVYTRNTLYRIIVCDGADVFLQGGNLFPTLTPAYVDGAGAGIGVLKRGWIATGLLLEFSVRGTRFVSSPVVAIAAQAAGFSVVH